MAVSNRKDKNQVPDLNIFEEQKKSNVLAKSVLKLAKEQEAKKLNDGYRYVASADGKTMILTKTNK